MYLVRRAGTGGMRLQHGMRALWWLRQCLRMHVRIALWPAHVAVPNAKRWLLRRWLWRDVVGRFSWRPSHVLRALQSNGRVDGTAGRRSDEHWRMLELQRRKHNRLHVPESAACVSGLAPESHAGPSGSQANLDHAALIARTSFLLSHSRPRAAICSGSFLRADPKAIADACRSRPWEAFFVVSG